MTENERKLSHHIPHPSFSAIGSGSGSGSNLGAGVSGVNKKVKREDVNEHLRGRATFKGTDLVDFLGDKGREWVVFENCFLGRGFLCNKDIIPSNS